MTNDLSEEQMRRERLGALRGAGVDPYPAVSNRSHTVQNILDQFDALLESQNEVTVCGRLKAIRRHGGVTFLVLEEESGAMQMVLNLDVLGEEAYEGFHKTADVGDFFEIRGVAFVTKKGEKSIKAHALHILSKSLLPLAEKWHGLTDVEKRYRHRELDLITNPEVRQRFVVRSKFVTAMRSYLDQHGFLEVETPMLQPIPGGASARPFITHHNALGTEFYLRIAPELYLKRLIVGGMEKIYEIGRCFRNEGIDYAHNPEFTMMEMYWAYAEKEAYVSFLEEMLRSSIQAALGTTVATLEGEEIDFGKAWPRKTFREAIQESCGIDIDAYASPESLVEATRNAHLSINFDGCIGMGNYVDELFKKTARAAIKQPTWIFDYPISLKPLTKVSPSDASKSACAQLIVNGAEVVNAYYHELNDPIEQRTRLEEQQALRDQGNEEAQWLDQDFLRSLEQGMPPTSGVGIGIDRFVAFITNAPNLKEVILFPTLKPVSSSEESPKPAE